MKYLTIDQILNELTKLKESGISGDSACVIAHDQNCSVGYVKRPTYVSQTSVAKSDFDKDSVFCKFVVNRGIPVVVIG